jgi:hypothetical protein
MNRLIIAAAVVLATSIMFAAAQPAKEPYAPGLGELMMATQVRHAKLWIAGQAKNWDLAAKGLEDAAKQDPARDGLPIPDMIKRNTEAPLDELEKAVEAKSSTKFAADSINSQKAAIAATRARKRSSSRFNAPRHRP